MVIYLSRAERWGGQFEKLIRLVKQSLFKAAGKKNLTKQELEEMLLDIAIFLNNRPLIKTEGDIQLPFSTPNTFLGYPVQKVAYTLFKPKKILFSQVPMRF